MEYDLFIKIQNFNDRVEMRLVIKKSGDLGYLDDCNWSRTPKHLVCKRTINHLAKPAK